MLSFHFGLVKVISEAYGSGFAGSGCEEDGDEAKWMGERYDTMALALYIRDSLL